MAVSDADLDRLHRLARQEGERVDEEERHHVAGVDDEEESPFAGRPGPTEEGGEEEGRLPPRKPQRRHRPRRNPAPHGQRRSTSDGSRPRGYSRRALGGAEAIATGNWRGVSPLGLALGFVVWAVAINLLRYGPAGAKGWLAAKFVNKPYKPQPSPAAPASAQVL